MKTKFQNKVYLGQNQNESIYLSAPSWDCGWYWGFGYLGNRNCHYHVDGLNEGKRINLYDAFKEHFGESLQILDSDLWKVCELFKTFYTLKEATEVLGRGGSHFTTNPIQDVIMNKEEVKRINEVVLPKLFDALYDVLMVFNTKKEHFEVIKNMVNVEFETTETKDVVKFMFDNGLNMDDLKSLNTKFGGLLKRDISLIHGVYWKTYHAAKKA